ncbi:MAG: DUF5615 family PIN-like protein [Actinomycetota bacterium]
MRIKLDENLDVGLAATFAAAGHDVDTVIDEGLSGANGPTVLSAATTEDRLVVTLDRGFGDGRAYPPGTHSGVLDLRLDDQALPAAQVAVDALLRAVDLDTLASCIAVYRNGENRVRRPARD